MTPPPHSAEKPAWHFALLIAIPALLLCGIFSFSPNFRFTDMATAKENPLGGDYLQEYVGGRILKGPNHDLLYDADFFNRQQHDEKIAGFPWDENKYFPAVYPPFWYAAVSPLSQLDYRTAACLWAGLMTVCLISAMVLIYRFTNVSVFLLLIFCLCTPVIHSISSGQKGTLLLLIFTVSFVLLKKAQPVGSGVVFALSLFKPYLGVCIGLTMIVRGNWRWVAATLLTVAAAVALTWLAMPKLSKDYIDVCLGFGDYVQSGGYDLAKSYSLWSGWQMLIPHNTTAKAITVATALATLLGSLFFLARLPRDEPESLARAFAVMMLVTVVTAPHFYYYDLTMLILPAAIFAGQASQGSRLSGRRRNRVRWLPVAFIAAALLGSGLIEQFGLVTNIALGPILLIAAIVSALHDATGIVGTDRHGEH